MILNCNVTGEDRKRLAKAISEFTGLPSKFLGVPSCAYEVGDCQISRSGSISFNENADIERIRALARALQENGFSVEAPEMETVAEESDILPDTGLQILLPLDGFNPDSLDRLTKLIDSKAALIRKALGADRLTVVGHDAHPGRDKRIHRFHRGPLQNGEGSQARHRNGERS